MTPSLNLVIAVGALLLLFVGRFVRLQIMRGTRWTLSLIVIAGLLSWAAGVWSPGTRWEELASIALMIALGLFAARVLVAVVVEWLLVQRVGVVMPRLARDVVSLLLYVIVVALVLRSTSGMDLKGLALGSAVITVLVGLAMQETLGTLLSGLTLAWERRLETGVWVEIDGLEGAVEELGWRSLVLRTNLDERILVPNSQVAKARMKILGTGDPPVAYRVHMHVAYSVPPHAVKKLLREACRDLPFTVSEPAPRLLAIKFDENGVLYECRLWTREPRRHNDIIDSLLTRAHAAFLREGFEIPLPQRVVRQGALPLVAAAERCREALARCLLFADLPADAMSALTGASRWLEYAPLEVVVREGDESRALYVVGIGEAAVLHGGEEVARVSSGEVFGEMAFLSGEPRSATVRAADALGVVEIDSRALRALLTDHEELAEELAGRMVARRAALEAHDEASSAPREHRGLAAYLLQRLHRLVSS